MTHFHIEFEATCPSDYNEAKVQEWLNKLLTPEERSTVCITPSADIGKCPILTRPGSWEQKAREALSKIRRTRDYIIPWDAADAATECIRIAKEALGEK